MTNYQKLWEEECEKTRKQYDRIRILETKEKNLENENRVLTLLNEEKSRKIESLLQSK